MLSDHEQRQLQNFLAHAQNADEALTLEELEGFLFGIAMTPDTFVPSEWLQAIFGEDGAQFPDQHTAEEAMGDLARVLERFHQRFISGKLNFPVLLTDPDKKTLMKLSDWAKGFDRALATRPELWMPDEVLAKQTFTAEEEALMSSLMIVLGVAFPERIHDVFELGNTEEIEEAWATLAAQLPSAVQHLQRYARSLSLH